MATRLETIAAITAYLASRKRIVGYNSAPTWGPGFTVHEVVMKYPLEVDGELRGQFWVIGFPRAKELAFRLEILFSAPICRLDYTGETHANSADSLGLGLPPIVAGPHNHSWPLNQRFFRGATKAPRLHDALPYMEPGRSFDAILRWFCTDTNIESLPGSHLIGLPEPGLLL